MIWANPALLGTILNTLILFFVYGYLYLQERKTYIGIWATGWAIYLLRFIFELFLNINKNISFISFFMVLATIASGFLLLWGTYIFLEKPMSKWWIAGTIGCFLLYIISYEIKLPFKIYMTSIFFYLGVVYIWTGATFLSTRKLLGFGKSITGWSFILWGIHKMNYPFVQPIAHIAIWGYLLASALTLVSGIGILIVYFDATRKEFAETKNLFQLLFEKAGYIILLVRSRDRKIVLANTAALEKYGYSQKEILELSVADLHSTETKGDVEKQIQQILVADTNFETLHRSKEGRDFPVEISGVAVVINGENYLLGIIHDISERQETDKKLKHFTFHDVLTGLKNRYCFELELEKLEINKIGKVAIIICDIDGLKFINDTLGHKNGDLHIIQAAQIISQCFLGKDNIFRIGGDEFAVLLVEEEVDNIEKSLAKLREAFQGKEQDNSGLKINISIGYGMRKEADISLETVFKEADDEMYKEKLFHKGSNSRGIFKDLLKVLEDRDYLATGHAERMNKLIVKLASKLALPTNKVDHLLLLSEMHDLGKIGISEQILLKAGPLNLAEREEIKRHCEIGYRIALSSNELMGIADLILKHHEWWNGEGYPLGLKGENIPLECRLFAIVDAYDAMTNYRPYRQALTKEAAIREINNLAGFQFDPNLTKQFLELIQE